MNLKILIGWLALLLVITGPNPIEAAAPESVDRGPTFSGTIRTKFPGDNTTMTVELIHPIAMEEGLRFAIREGGRTVGAGRVTKIIK